MIRPLIAMNDDAFNVIRITAKEKNKPLNYFLVELIIKGFQEIKLEDALIKTP